MPFDQRQLTLVLVFALRLWALGSGLWALGAGKGSLCDMWWGGCIGTLLDQSEQRYGGCLYDSEPRTTGPLPFCIANMVYEAQANPAQ